MSDENDLDTDGWLSGGDGFQYRLKLHDGGVEHFRDHDKLAAVLARIFKAKATAARPPGENIDAYVAAVHVPFSGARAVEGEQDGKPVIGPLRGKGFVDGTRVASCVYSTTDGTEVSMQAFEAAVALLDVQRAALSTLGQQMQPAGAEQPGESGGGDGLMG